MTRCLWSLILLLLATAAAPALGQDAKTLTCGIAAGFPPYQFVQDGNPTGFDADVARAVARRLGQEARFEQGAWDDVLNLLRFGRIDAIAGMEINDFRREYFDFSTPYAKRHDAVFVPANSTLETTEDLFGRIISGDRHSYVELLWKNQGIHHRIRIMQTASKEESMTLLAQGKTVAAIMPLQVGRFLARGMGFEVRVLLNPDPGSQVALAVRKGDKALLERIDAALAAMAADGELEALRTQWFGAASDEAAPAGNAVH